LEINFPFFAFEKGAGYYCGKIREERNTLLIEMYRAQHKGNIRYMPEISPTDITTSFLGELIKECRKIDGELNAIIVQHYVVQPPSKKKSTGRGDFKVQHIIIAYEEGDSKEGVKENIYRLHLNYFHASPTDIHNDKLHVIIISNKRYVQGKRYQNQGDKYSEVRISESETKRTINGRITYRDRALITRMTSWPLIVRVPMNIKTIKITDLPGDSKTLKLAEVLLLEALLGSNIMIEKGLKGKQLPLLIPTPLLSSLHHKYKQYHSRQFTYQTSPPTRSYLLALPSVSYISVGGIMVSVDLSKHFEKLSDYLAAKLKEAYSLLEEESEKLVIQVNFKNCGVNVDQHIDSLGVEAILKTIVDNFILAGQTIGFYKIKDELKEEIRQEIKLPHRIVRLEVPISLHDIGFYRLGLASNHIYVAYDVVRRRTGFLKSILSKIPELRNGISSSRSSGYDDISLLLAAFLSDINNKAVKILERKMRIGGRTFLVSIEPCILAHRMALLLLEYGLHALSHLLLKYLHEALKVHRGSLRELIVLSLGEDYWDLVNPPSYYMNVAINGFRYRLSSPTSGIKGVIMITSNKPFTHRSWESLIPKVFNLRDFINFAFEILGKDPSSDRCLSLWNDEANKMRARLKLYDDSQISYFMRSLENLIPLGGGSKVALPLLDVRALIEGLWEGERLKSLRPYLDALYTATIPFCFDGCYNCVLVERQCLSNPLSSEWVVSKSVARLILSELSRGVL